MCDSLTHKPSIYLQMQQTPKPDAHVPDWTPAVKNYMLRKIMILHKNFMLTSTSTFLGYEDNRDLDIKGD